MNIKIKEISAKINNLTQEKEVLSLKIDILTKVYENISKIINTFKKKTSRIFE